MNTVLSVLGESTIRATIIAFAVMMLLRAMRVKSPAVLHRAWTCVLVMMLLLPPLSLWAPRVMVPILPPAPAARQELPDARPSGKSLSGPVAPRPADRTATPMHYSPDQTPARAPGKSYLSGGSQIVALLYLAGFCALLARLFMGLALASRLARGASWDGRVFHSAQCRAPLSVGLFRPRILLPMYSGDWDQTKLGAVIEHEQAHVRRRDPLVEWLARLNRCFYWFHPLAWWLCRKLSALAEQACDEAVLERGFDAVAYAEFLLELARSIQRGRALVAAWGSSINGSRLAVRVRLILTVGRSPAPSRTRVAILTVLGAAVILGPAFVTLARTRAMLPMRQTAGTISPFTQFARTTPENMSAVPMERVSEGNLSNYAGGKLMPPEVPLASKGTPAFPTDGMQTRNKPQGVHATLEPSTRGYPGSPLPAAGPGTGAISTVPMSPQNPADAAQEAASRTQTLPSESVLMQTGKDLLDRSQYFEARLAFQTLIRTHPGSTLVPEAYLAVGNALLLQGGIENLLLAEDLYRNFIVFFPANPRAAQAQMKIVSILMRQMQDPARSQKEARRALSEINKFIALFPNSEFIPTVNQYRDEVLLKLAETGASISGHILDTAGNPIPSVTVSLVDRATEETLSSASSDPAGYFEISARPSKNKFDVLFEKPGYRSYRFTGDDPYSKPFKIILTTMAEMNCQVADFYFWKGNYLGAISRYQEAIRDQPDMVAANDGLGRSYRELGESDKALAVYREFIKKYPESPALSDFKARIAEIETKKH